MQLGVTRRQFLAAAVGGGAAVALPRGASAAPGIPASVQDAREALAWMQTTYDLVLQENLSPPAAARVYAHTAIAMYEAAVGGMPAHRTLGGQLRGLAAAPARLLPASIDWSTAVVTSAAAVLRSVLPFAGTGTRASLDAAEAAVVARRRAAGVPAATLTASAAHGLAVATPPSPFQDRKST